MTRAAWACVLAATALMALMMGTRSAFSLFVSPLNTATGIGLAGLGLAIALGQLGVGSHSPRSAGSQTGLAPGVSLRPEHGCSRPQPLR
jgi:hypothetical protein